MQSVDTIEIVWSVAWSVTAVALGSMERWAWSMTRDHAEVRKRTGLNGSMTSLARWFLWLFRSLTLAAVLMGLLVVPSLLLPPPLPRSLAPMADWQRVVQGVSGLVALLCLLGTCAVMLSIAGYSAWVLRRLAPRRERKP